MKIVLFEGEEDSETVKTLLRLGRFWKKESRHGVRVEIPEGRGARENEGRRSKCLTPSLNFLGKQGPRTSWL